MHRIINLAKIAVFCVSYFPSLHGKQAYYNPALQIVKKNIGLFFVKTAKNLYFCAIKSRQNKNPAKLPDFYFLLNTVN